MKCRCTEIRREQLLAVLLLFQFPYSLAQRFVSIPKIAGLIGEEQKSKTEIFSNKTMNFAECKDHFTQNSSL